MRGHDLASWRGLVVGAVCLGAAGCSGGGFGESISVPQDRRTKLDGGFAPGDSLRVPADQPCNIVDAQRHSTGSGRSESHAEPEGMAGCSATVDETGAAWAEFQLGHVIYNDATEALDATVAFDCEFEYAVSSEEPSLHVPDMIALKLFIQDSTKRVLHRDMLVNYEGGLGAHQRTGHESPSFNVILEPGMTYQLILAGRVEVTATEEGQPLGANLEVRNFDIVVEAK